jgi:hypothetical protein
MDNIQKHFFNSNIGGVESILGPLGMLDTTGLLYLSWVIVMIENLVEWRLAGETEVLWENLPQRHFVHRKSYLPDPGSNPGRRGGKSVTNRNIIYLLLFYKFLSAVAVSHSSQFRRAECQDLFQPNSAIVCLVMRFPGGDSVSVLNLLVSIPRIATCLCRNAQISDFSSCRGKQSGIQSALLVSIFPVRGMGTRTSSVLFMSNNRMFLQLHLNKNVPNKMTNQILYIEKMEKNYTKNKVILVLYGVTLGSFL